MRDPLSQRGQHAHHPREGGYLVRLHIELDNVRDREMLENRSATPEKLTAVANRILHPYRVDVRDVGWWSVYEIGQRLCGMNVSMNDTWNLGWKLAAVLRGTAKPELLHTYSEERQKVAQQLIDFDREFAAMFSAHPAEDGDPSGGGVPRGGLPGGDGLPLGAGRPAGRRQGGPPRPRRPGGWRLAPLRLRRPERSSPTRTTRAAATPPSVSCASSWSRTRHPSGVSPRPARPDQYVAHVLPLHGHQALTDFFAGVLVDAK